MMSEHVSQYGFEHAEYQHDHVHEPESDDNPETGALTGPAGGVSTVDYGAIDYARRVEPDEGVEPADGEGERDDRAGAR